MKCALSYQMKFRDARTIPPEQLYERRKQAVALRKKGMSFLEISKIVGVRRDVVGQWVCHVGSRWHEGTHGGAGRSPKRKWSAP